MDHLFPNIPTNRFDTSGLLSRTLIVSIGETKDVLNFHRDGEWRLSIQENDGASQLLVEITERFAQSQEKISFHVPPGGAKSYLGTGPASVKIAAEAANTEICIQLSAAPRTQFPLERDCNRQTLNANPGAFLDIGTGAGLVGGFAPPFMSYAAIMCDGNIDLQTVNLAGNIVFSAANLPPNSLLLNQFKVGSRDRLQARGSAAPQICRVIWYNQR